MRLAGVGGLRNEMGRPFLRKYLRLIVMACLSIIFLGCGAIAAGLLYGEENDTKAILLFLAALLGAAGCIFFPFVACGSYLQSRRSHKSRHSTRLSATTTKPFDSIQIMALPTAHHGKQIAKKYAR